MSLKPVPLIIQYLVKSQTGKGLIIYRISDVLL